MGQCLKAQTEYPFRNPDLPNEQRINNLISLLKPEEKIGMMMHDSRAVPRLGIPAYNWWSEALHGVARAGTATVFPQAIGMGATWNVPAQYRTFDIISTEARAKYNEAVRNNNRSIYYGLSFWTPNINIFRDPRWGRGQETYGEDPYLTSQLGLATVKGLQGDNPKYFKTHACAKHYAVHSGPEWNRHSYNAVVSDRDLWETYLPAFKALVKEGNVREVMCAYNALNGEPCCGNNLLLTNILRKKWGYNGMVVTDCWAMNDFFVKGAHATKPDAPSAAADAIIHSTNLECGDSFTSLNAALKSGLVSIEQIDASLRKILQGWIELGMLDPQERVPWSKLPYSVVDAPEHRQQALKVARESMTLLKNNASLLPLTKSVKKIAVIGPNADDSTMLWGNYNGTPSSTVTILEGIKKKLPQTEIVYEKGCDHVDPWVKTSLYEYLSTGVNGQKGLKVEFYNNNKREGQPAATLTNSIGISYSNGGGTPLAPGVNVENTSSRISGIFTAPYSGPVAFSASASDEYKLFVDDKEVLTQTGYFASVTSEHIMNMEKGKTYRIRLEQSQKGQHASVNFNVYRKDPQEFSGLLNKISDADVVIYVGGLSPALEGEEMFVNAEGFKGGDKVSIDLPTVQRKLLAELRKAGKPVVFVLCTGSSLALEQDEKNYDALLCAWYGGQAAGTAVADVLFGDYNPAGRLPVTFYKTLAQLDSGLSKHNDPARQGFENYDMEGRTYRYLRSEPLYPFGHGLSYSAFKYGAATLDKKVLKAGQNVSITIPVSNNSKKGGDEVVQVYVKRDNDPQAPVKSLRAFKRLFIEPGKTQYVKLTLDNNSFKYFDKKANDLVTKAGSYTIEYGGTSASTTLNKIKIKVQPN